MPIITGTLRDFGLQSLADYQPTLTFTASGPGVNEDRIFATRPIQVVPSSTGLFSVDLIATSSITPDVWYEVAIRWLEPNGGYSAVDFLNWKLNVPSAGGNVAELLRVPAGANDVWIGPTEPEASTIGALWIDTSTTPPTLKRKES